MDFPALTLRQLKAALEKNDAVAGLTESDDDDDDDDDDDEIEEKPKARKGKKAEPEAEEEDDDDDDEEEADDDDEDETEDEADDDDDDDEADEEETDDEDDDEEAEDEEEEEATTITAERFTVVSTSEKDEIITVKVDGKNTKFWLGTGVEADWDVVTKGNFVTIDAAQDDEGDWVITALKSRRARKAA
jgi:hypothetical protein